MAHALVSGHDIDRGAHAPDLLDKQWSLLPPVLLDALPPGSVGDHTNAHGDCSCYCARMIMVLASASSPRYHHLHCHYIDV